MKQRMNKIDKALDENRKVVRKVVQDNMLSNPVLPLLVAISIIAFTMGLMVGIIVSSLAVSIIWNTYENELRFASIAVVQLLR